MNLKQILCIHEAGHCVVGFAFGGTLGGCDIEKDSGNARVENLPDRHQAVMLAAGLAAEQRAGIKHPYDTSAGDRVLFKELGLSSSFESAMERADRHLAARWRKVLELAAFLQKNPITSGVEIAEILEPKRLATKPQSHQTRKINELTRLINKRNQAQTWPGGLQIQSSLSIHI